MAPAALRILNQSSVPTGRPPRQVAAPARPRPVARRLPAPPLDALAIPTVGDAWRRREAVDEDQTSVLQLISAFFASLAEPAVASEEEEIPPEYRAAADRTSHGGGWVHSHIAERLATAGADEGEGL